MKLITIETAGSGKQYVHNRAQSKRMIEIAKRYGCNGFRPDYSATTQYTVGMDGFWFFDDIQTAEKYIAEALPVLEEDLKIEAARIAEEEKLQDEVDQRNYDAYKKNQENFSKKYPNGKIVFLDVTGPKLGLVSVRARIVSWDDEEMAVHRALNRAVAKLKRSTRYFFVSEYEKFGHDFFGRVGSGCPTGGTNLDERIWADYYTPQNHSNR